MMRHNERQSRRLRVLQVVDGFRMGGAENKLWELIARLDRNKYEILLATVGPSGPLRPRFEKLDIEIFDFCRRWSFDPQPLFRLYRLMKQRRIDIVQTTLFWADVIGAFAAKMAGVPAILSWETVSHEGDPYHNNVQRRSGYRLAMACADLIVAVSHEVKQSLVRRRGIPAGKIRVIHYGVDLEQFHPNGRDTVLAKRRELGIHPESFLLGTVARLEPWKGHRYLIEAFAQLAPQFPDVHLVFVGDGSLRAELEAQAQRLGVRHRIFFLGVRQDVAQWVNAIDLFVLPSLPGEGLPNVLLEAMACRKPVIATRVGGVPELVRPGENGFLVPPGEVAALREVLQQVLRDRSCLAQLGRNARATVENSFTLQQQIAAFEETLDTLFARKSQR
ncbi:MAG: glycosyltransferase [candidate division KSB1 bacterium]|nr:glycosyltransferase [candidate division KSB1 bacterium]MDZ7275966.1 glycosyltransferase [candidate division KSB1 bacterium]MDZ7285752.1 glycosyltransferase [candidate division KSB1 bacterium]MDZ7298784.1 glycosyltransferase [candidate division KSB1 bacterium]MDZ7307926.1 glycosyltransferase [candidate division KSB1 bacterium]